MTLVVAPCFSLTILFGLLACQSLSIDSQTYNVVTLYNANGQVAGYTYPDGKQVTRSYHADGQLHEVHHDGNLVDRRIYDSAGRMTRSTYGNGVVTDHDYNADNTLTSITHSGTGSAIGDYSYTWDVNKNKLSETITGVMSGYGFDNTAYDTEDRLTGWNRDDNNLDQSWNLSLVGDWNNITENGNVQSRTHGPTHELLTADSQSVTHDAKGNMTLIPASLRPNALSLTWDQDNRMSSASTDGNTVTHRYDALGRRVARNNDIYVQVGQQTVADYVSGTTSTTPAYTYVYASYIDEPVVRAEIGGLRYYHRNQQYSITALTDSSGNVTERYAYTAYGTPAVTDGVGATLTTSADSNRYTYTGREWDDALDLYHFRARMYDPFGGRFVSVDPIKYWDGANLYRSYFSVKSVDPSGKRTDFFNNNRQCFKCQDMIDRYEAGHGGIIIVQPTFEKGPNKKGCTILLQCKQNCGPNDPFGSVPDMTPDDIKRVGHIPICLKIGMTPLDFRAILEHELQHAKDICHTNPENLKGCQRCVWYEERGCRSLVADGILVILTHKPSAFKTT